MIEALTDWRHLELAQPWALLLLALVPLAAGWPLRKRSPAFRLSSLGVMGSLPQPLRSRLRWLLPLLRIVALVLLVVAIARPRSGNSREIISSEGIDLVLSLDVSGSMQAEDLRPNRIEAAKKMAAEFISQRKSDRIGLVIFSGESFTLCPVTIDHRIIQDQISNMRLGMLADGTAIGDGLATAIDRLRHAKGKSKVVVLMTDGVNNAQKIDPQTALELAKVYGIKVYTIGVGTREMALVPVQGPFGVQRVMQKMEIDEALLQKIADETGGRYFRATDNASLQQIYTDINKLEKTKVEMTSYKEYTELFLPFAVAAVVCLLLEALLRYTVFRTFE